MVTGIRKGAKLHLYVDEWIAAKDSSYEKICGQLGVSRTTVWRWSKEQHRLDPGKISALAGALQIEPQDFYRLPSPKPERPSIDKLLENAPDDDFQRIIDMARRLISKAS